MKLVVAPRLMQVGFGFYNLQEYLLAKEVTVSNPKLYNLHLDDAAVLVSTELVSDKIVVTLLRLQNILLFLKDKV